MDHKKALEILEINLQPREKLDIKYLKRQYHKMALENHPDKNNNSLESTEKFKQINDSYNFLKRELSFINDINSQDYSENFQSSQQTTDYTDYSNILKFFIDSIIKEIYKNESEYKELVKSIISDIVMGCKKISLKLFEKLNKESAIEIYGFLSKYKNILRISDETINEVNKIIKDKYNNDLIYILNPSIDDLLDNNIYKLNIDGEIYFVPLWHDIIYFDKLNNKTENNNENENDTEIIVNCVPQLPSHISIDENNNIIVNVDISFTYSLYEEESIKVFIGKKLLEIPINQLYIRRFQTYCFYGNGISEIKEDNIYETGNKGNIICKININNNM